MRAVRVSIYDLLLGLLLLTKLGHVHICASAVGLLRERIMLKQVEDEKISQMHKLEMANSLYILNNIDIYFIFIFYTFKMTEKEKGT